MRTMRRFGLLLCLAAFAQPVGAGQPPVAPPQSRPYGATYGEWGAAWWQWALAQPASVNPVLDPSGAYCGADQSGQVWFLAGTFGFTFDRVCTVPLGKALLFPVLNIAYIRDPGETITVEEMRQLLASIVENPSDLFVIVDGEEVADVGRWLERSPTFTVVLPGDNILGDPYTGVTLGPCVDEGFYILLPPLPAGDHTIRFGGTTWGGFSTDVTYHLTVR